MELTRVLKGRPSYPRPPGRSHVCDSHSGGRGTTAGQLSGASCRRVGRGLGWICTAQHRFFPDRPALRAGYPHRLEPGSDLWPAGPQRRHPVSAGSCRRRRYPPSRSSRSDLQQVGLITVFGIPDATPLPRWRFVHKPNSPRGTYFRASKRQSHRDVVECRACSGGASQNLTWTIEAPILPLAWRSYSKNTRQDITLERTTS